MWEEIGGSSHCHSPHRQLLRSGLNLGVWAHEVVTLLALSTLTFITSQLGSTSQVKGNSSCPESHCSSPAPPALIWVFSHSALLMGDYLGCRANHYLGPFMCCVFQGYRKLLQAIFEDAGYLKTGQEKIETKEQNHSQEETLSRCNEVGY